MDFDLIILGGGCAGLSLAMRLAQSGSSCPKTLIVEKRAQYIDDRTWSFWDDRSSSLSQLANCRWPKMAVRSGEKSVELDCGTTPYHMVSSQTFYSEALNHIRSNPRIQLRLGTGVVRPARKTGALWTVETSGGVFHGKAIVDCLPGDLPSADGAMLWQSFYGHEIECDGPVFDASKIDLMDFSPGNPDLIRFTYVLPVSPYRALVEVTVLGPEPVRRESLSSDLSLAIARRTSRTDFRTLRSEHGVLPMGLTHKLRNTDRSYVHAGLASGAARPSTGYAFQRIQRWADVCASKIVKGYLPISHPPDPAILRALDHLFLSVLRSRPERAPSLFLALFEKTGTPRMIRFLSDRATLLDYASVAWALPFFLFLQEIPRAIAHHSNRPAHSLIT